MLEALGVALRTDGTRGLFRGTVPLLSREVPFYVVGMTGYAYLKRVFDGTFIDESSLSVTQSCPCNKPLQQQAVHADADTEMDCSYLHDMFLSFWSFLRCVALQAARLGVQAGI